MTREKIKAPASLGWKELQHLPSNKFNHRLIALTAHPAIIDAARISAAVFKSSEKQTYRETCIRESLVDQEFH